MQQLFKFVDTKLHKIVSYIIKYVSLLKGSTTGTSIKIINSTVKQNFIWQAFNALKEALL